MVIANTLLNGLGMYGTMLVWGRVWCMLPFWTKRVRRLSVWSFVVGETVPAGHRGIGSWRKCSVRRETTRKKNYDVGGRALAVDTTVK